MSRLRFLTAGESHGPALVGIVEGIPAGLKITEDSIFKQLQRRQMGHGRGGRMKIEKDRARILSGVRFGQTLGSPIALYLENKDWKNWQEKMAIEEKPSAAKEVTVPRPGHADFAGAFKYGHQDIRNVLERASARETAIRVALGSIAREFLNEFDIRIVSHVVQIHSLKASFSAAGVGKVEAAEYDLKTINTLADASPVRCLDKTVEQAMIARIDEAKTTRNTVGGIFEVIAFGLPIGLGSHVHWDRKLDARIGQAMMSIPAMKGVEIGQGFEAGTLWGSEVHDEIYYDGKAESFYRSHNHAGGLEGGITNGMPLVIRVAMKPISTLMRPLNSVDLSSKEKTQAHR
ncbi:chorismate synthase, partial [bacterium]|nr:chorismate synthase [bacterium]